MDRRTARVIAVIFVVLAVALVVMATIVRYARGQPTDFTALFGAMMCIFFCIIVTRDRGAKR